MIEEHERAVLNVDLPEHRLKASDVGVVVHIYSGAVAYEVEFLALDGSTIDVVTVEAEQVRPVSHRDVLHVRERAA
ncbi:DUF4926 domain-containing protein [bacterium]|nr:DUF4926 domain-containing protein [bacterium]